VYLEQLGCLREFKEIKYPYYAAVLYLKEGILFLIELSQEERSRAT
jgi:hypothetical protein